MSEINHSDKKSIDELLAAYVDQITDGGDITRIPLSETPELKELQETVQALHPKTPIEATPSSAMMIKTNVIAAWQKEYSQTTGKAHSRQKYRSRTRRRQIAAARIAIAAVIVIITAFIIFPDAGISGGTASGTAAAKPGVWAFIGGLLIAGTALWWWFNNRRK